MSDYGSDYEHGWNRWPFHGQNIMTCVRNQGGRPTCIFQALCAAYEIDFRRLLALEESISTDLRFDVESFIRELEEEYGDLGTDPPRMRLQNAIRLFQERGVLASSNVWEDQMRVQMVGSHEHPNITFEAVETILEEGRPVIGGFTICENDNFRRLGRNEVYKFDPSIATWGTYNHLVVFIGSGTRAKKPYLVFLNSEGEGFGEEGYGRVWFNQVRAFRTIDLEGALQPPPPPSRKRSWAASNSSSSSSSRRKRYRSNRSNPGGSDALTDKNEFVSGPLEDETKEMAPVKSGRKDKDDDGSGSSDDDLDLSCDDDDMIEDGSSSEEDEFNDEIDESDDVKTKKLLRSQVGKKRVAETALKAHASDKKAKVPASDKKAKIAAPSGLKTGDKSCSKTPANSQSKEKSPKSAGSHSCKSCSKTFGTDAALQSHQTAKHKEATK